MTEAIKPATSARQSKSMWNESEISPRLLLMMPYTWRASKRNAVNPHAHQLDDGEGKVDEQK